MYRRRLQESKHKKVQSWEKKTHRSPFLINLLAEALTESSDLEALRREKRAIIEEERCLKALMDIEKSSGHRKAQMLAALRAEKQRHAAKADYRRRRFTEALDSHFEREAEVLREKHDVPPK
eukprot:g8002.t1